MRDLSTIAMDIRRDWTKPNYAAVPYLCAMSRMGSIKDHHGADSGRSVVLYFLGNAGAWRGPVAKQIKAELKSMLEA